MSLWRVFYGLILVLTLISCRLGDNTIVGSIGNPSTLPSITDPDDDNEIIEKTTNAYTWGANWSGNLARYYVDDFLTPTRFIYDRLFKKVKVGNQFLCGIAKDNKIYCWMFNAWNQASLGTGVDYYQGHPTEVLGGRTYKDLDMGSDSVCAIDSNDDGYCWGAGGFGQLGNTANSRSNVPVAVSGGLKFKQIETTGYSVCGLTLSNVLYCWGQGSRLALGTPTNHNTPQLVPGGHIFTQITAGYNHFCGVKSNGEIYCWGSNSDGQIGNGNFIWADFPEKVLSTENFKLVEATHGNLTCAINTNNKLFCWGNDDTGALGIGGLGDQNTPQAVEPSISFKAITTGGGFNNHACGITTDDKNYCWGTNSSGQLGIGNTSAQNIPQLVESDVVFIWISAGLYSSVGLDSTGKLYQWGYRHYFQEIGPIAEPINEDPIELEFISGGAEHTCGIDAGQKIWCWGSYEPLFWEPRPVRVEPTKNFKSLSAGYYYNCAIDTNDDAYCWGEGNNGQLGNGTVDSASLLPVSGGLKFQSLSAGWNSTCGITLDQDVYCWGSDVSGQLGDGPTVSTGTTPVPLNTLLKFSQLSSGENFHCGVTTSNEVYCWGEGSAGQLGDNLSADSDSPVKINSIDSFIEVTLGEMVACALTTIGEAYCWGDPDTNSSLGDGTNNASPSPVAVLGGHIFVQITSGGYHNCGLTSDGTAYCWGSREWSQLGDGVADDGFPAPLLTQPIPVDTDLKFKSIEGNDYGTSVLLKD